MEFSFAPQDEVQAFPDILCNQLSLIVEQLKEPELTVESRLALTEQLCGLLKSGSSIEVDSS